jgi:hypothetical protein
VYDATAIGELVVTELVKELATSLYVNNPPLKYQQLFTMPLLMF